MKRILPFICASALSTFAFSQQQIGNSGFETWNTITGSNEEPTNWNSFLTASGSFSFAASNQITRSLEPRPGSTGSYSALIYSTSVLGVIANGNLTVGRINMGSASPVNANNYNSSIIANTDFSEALTDTPDSIVFWVKFTPVTATSQARAAIILHDSYAYRDGGTVDAASTPHTVATAYLNYGTTNGQWVRKSIPFSYVGPATTNTFILATFTTNMTPGGGNANDQVWVDDVQLIYNPVNDPIVANPDSEVTTGTNPVVIDVLDNDTDSDDGVDAGSVTVTTPAAHGTTSVDAITGEITYTPNAGFFGTDTFIYTVCDEGTPATCDTALVTVLVNGNMNAVNDAITTPQDQAIPIPVLANDTDPENSINTASVAITVQPLNGNVSVNATTGVVTYTPDAGYFGTDVFTYVVCDNSASITCDDAVVTVTVTEVVVGVNNQIIVNDDAVTVAQDDVIVIDVTANDIDPENAIDDNSLTVTVQPLHGAVTVNTTTGEITYTPAAGYFGADAFTYSLCDIGTPVTCDNAVVSVNVTSTAGLETAGGVAVTIFASEGLLNIQSEELLTGTAAIYATSGQLVQVSAIEPVIAFSQQPGIYFVRLQTQHGMIVKKIALY